MIDTNWHSIKYQILKKIYQVTKDGQMKIRTKKTKALLHKLKYIELLKESSSKTCWLRYLKKKID